MLGESALIVFSVLLALMLTEFFRATIFTIGKLQKEPYKILSPNLSIIRKPSLKPKNII